MFLATIRDVKGSNHPTNPTLIWRGSYHWPAQVKVYGVSSRSFVLLYKDMVIKGYPGLRLEVDGQRVNQYPVLFIDGSFITKVKGCQLRYFKFDRCISNIRNWLLMTNQ